MPFHVFTHVLCVTPALSCWLVILSDVAMPLPCVSHVLSGGSVPLFPMGLQRPLLSISNIPYSSVDKFFPDDQ